MNTLRVGLCGIAVVFLLGNDRCQIQSKVRGACAQLCDKGRECNGLPRMSFTGGDDDGCETQCALLFAGSAQCAGKLSAAARCAANVTCAQFDTDRGGRACAAQFGALEACMPDIEDEVECCTVDDPCGLADDGDCDCTDQPWDAADCAP